MTLFSPCQSEVYNVYNICSYFEPAQLFYLKSFTSTLNSVISVVLRDTIYLRCQINEMPVAAGEKWGNAGA